MTRILKDFEEETLKLLSIELKLYHLLPNIYVFEKRNRLVTYRLLRPAMFRLIGRLHRLKIMQPTVIIPM